MNKVFIALLVLFGGLGTLLVLQAMKTNTQQVFTPSELSGKTKSYPRVRVVGKVAAEELKYQIEPKIQLSFAIQDPEGDSQEKVTVSYDKLMPDMFAPGRSVIIDGEFRDGIVYASNLMTQCPSKYEPPDPHHQKSKEEEKGAVTNKQISESTQKAEETHE